VQNSSTPAGIARCRASAEGHRDDRARDRRPPLLESDPLGPDSLARL